MIKKMKLISVCLLAITILFGCSNDQEVVGENLESVPTLGIGYMFSNHQTPLIVAAAKHEDFKDEGVYFKEVMPKEKYILMEGDKEVANIDLITANNGGEVMTMMGQGHLDMGLSSMTLPITSIDKGAKMKILSPIHADGIALVMPHDSSVEDLDTFIAYTENREEPVKIGYHSPVNAPVILFETAMKEMGIRSTENPEDVDADILLINLKGTANLMPALLSGEVDGWVGPSPFPELAELNGAGKIVLDMRDLPSTSETNEVEEYGYWHEFPCCVFSANDSAIEEHPEVVEKMLELLTIASDFANNNREETGKIVSDWMGVDEEAAKNTITVFTTNPNERWQGHAELIYEVLQNSGRLEENLKERSFEEVRENMFDLSFANRILQNR
ncbi:MAG: ABC transporter substrate-binding protein [Clostridiaceae bacterium]|nr:ABC transporter substrate-binding protein [Clostridiaceae bacterium]